jgi:hypothetical protein
MEPQERIDRIKREIDWRLVSDDDLRFAYHLLNPHAASFGVILDDIVSEMSVRVCNGGFQIMPDQPVKVVVRNVPDWLTKWPFVLFWKQGRDQVKK